MAELKDISAALQVAFDAAKELENFGILKEELIKILKLYPKLAAQVIDEMPRLVYHLPEGPGTLGVFYAATLHDPDAHATRFQKWIAHYSEAGDKQYNVYFREGTKAGKGFIISNKEEAIYLCEQYVEEEGYYLVDSKE